MSAPATFDLAIPDEVKAGGASEGAAGPCPQVFVVDSQANYISRPPMEKKQRTTAAHRLLLLLVGLALTGLLFQGYFIYRLYQNKETGSIMSQVGLKDLNQVTMNQRPFAHLLGSNNLTLANVVQWVKEGDAFTHDMTYHRDGLIVEKEGFYYVYSKVQVNAAEDCLLIQHKVMKYTSAYDKPIGLMKSKKTPKPSNAKSSTGEDLWNNYLAGVFLLREGEKIIVQLESKQNVQLRPGRSENFMGAFMIFVSGK